MGSTHIYLTYVKKCFLKIKSNKVKRYWQIKLGVFGFKKYVYLFCYLILLLLPTQTTAASSISVSNRALSLSYHSGVYRSSTFHFLQEVFLCIHNLAVCHKRPRFQLILALNMPSSLSLIISCLWFKVRNMWLFFLWTFRGHCSY